MKAKFICLFLVISGGIKAQDASRGQELFKACIQCHGEKGMGKSEKDAPRIAGQHDWYIVSSLKAFRSGEKRQNPAMLPYIENLSEQDFKDLAAYISAL